jgi:hypothetical protein
MKPAVTDTPAAAPAPKPEPETFRDWFLLACRGVNHFWFAPAAPTMLGMMRIACGILLVYVHLSYSVALLAYVGPEGWGDRQVTDWMRREVAFRAPPTSWEQPTPEEMQKATEKGYIAWSVWYHVDDPAWIWTLHVVFLVAMVCFTLGFGTRLSGVISWVGMISYVNRIPFMTFGMDAMMVIVTTYLLIGVLLGPCAMYSVDQWLARKRIGWWRDDAVDADHPPKSAAANVALRLVQVHFCCIYLISGLSKLQGTSWWNLEAVWGTIANPNFSPMQSSLFMGFLVFLAKHRLLYHLVIGGGVLFTLALEIGFPFLVWSRHTRWLMVTGSVLLHTGIGFLMGLGGFSMYMLVMLMAFVPPEAMLAFLRQLRAKWQGSVGKYAGRLVAAKKPPAAGKPKEELAMHQ